MANPAWCRRSKSRSWPRVRPASSFAARPITRTVPSIPSSSICSGSCSLQREETPQAKLAKLQQALAAYRFPQADTLPLLAALLSLPQPEGIPPLTLSPQKQKQKTQEALVAWIVEEAEKAAVYCAWEDLHWADPSTLEVLTLFLEQVPTTRLFAVLTFRPDFTPPWRPALASHPAHAQSLRAAAGRGDGGESHRRQSLTRGGGAADCEPRPMGCRCLSKS